MYLSRSIEQISESTKAAFSRFLPGTDSNIIQNFLYGTRKTLALVLKEMDLRAAYLYNQIFVVTADDYHAEFRHAPEVGLTRKPAGFASGNVDLVVSAATTLPAGLRFLSGGITYFSTAEVSAGGAGTVQIPVRALASGLDGNRSAGEVMVLSEPGLYPLAASSGVVSGSAIAGGAEKESLEDLKARILARKRNPPQGGNEADYERFGEGLSHVSQAWARRPDGGPGSLAIWFLNAEGEIPVQSEIDQYMDHLHSRRLLGLRDIQINAPVDVPLNITVDLDPDTVDLRERVTASIKAMLKERSRPGLPPKRPGLADDDFILSRSWISEAISTVVGEDSHVLALPAGDLTYSVGRMPLTVNVSFV